MFKYRFKAIIQDKYMKESCEFLQKCDLGIGEVGVQYVFTFTSEKDLLALDIKEHFGVIFKELELQLLHLEGGKVE